jgi:hypothetical protein
MKSFELLSKCFSILVSLTISTSCESNKSEQLVLSQHSKLGKNFKYVVLQPKGVKDTLEIGRLYKYEIQTRDTWKKIIDFSHEDSFDLSTLQIVFLNKRFIIYSPKELVVSEVNFINWNLIPVYKILNLKNQEDDLTLKSISVKNQIIIASVYKGLTPHGNFSSYQSNDFGLHWKQKN